MVTTNEIKLMSIIEEINNHYDPEYDIGNPQVSYTEKRLLDAITILVQHIGARDQVIADLINQINDLEQDIIRINRETKSV